MTMLFGTFSTKDNGFVVDAGTLLANIGPIVVKNSLKALAISKLLVIVFPLIRKLLLLEFLPFFMPIIVLRTNNDIVARCNLLCFEVNFDQIF